jgi:hypothetical protein
METMVDGAGVTGFSHVLCVSRAVRIACSALMLLLSIPSITCAYVSSVIVGECPA